MFLIICGCLVWWIWAKQNKNKINFSETHDVIRVLGGTHDKVLVYEECKRQGECEWVSECECDVISCVKFHNKL